MPFGFGKSKKKKAAEAKAAEEEANKIVHTHELKFGSVDNEIFNAKEKKQLLLRFTAIANGRDHITKQDFLDQPEVGCNPLMERVIDVVLEDNGHAARRIFEGNLIMATFDDTERERFIGIHWDPYVPPSKANKNKGTGAIIEEVKPGGVASQKGNLHSLMRLIAVRTATDKSGTWNYMMGRTYAEIIKFVAKAKRPMTLLLQDPEDPSIAKKLHDDLVKVDESYGGGGFLARHKVVEKHKKKMSNAEEKNDGNNDSDSSDSDDDDEAKKAQTEAEKWKIRNYEVEFNDPKLGIGKGKKGFGLKLGPIENKAVGARVDKVQEESFSDNDGRIKMGHYLIGIGKKDATQMTYEKIKQALVTVLNKKSRPIVLTFEVKVKRNVVAESSLDDDGGHSDDLRPSHCFRQRENLNHNQVTSDDFLDILAVSNWWISTGNIVIVLILSLLFFFPS